MDDKRIREWAEKWWANRHGYAIEAARSLLAEQREEDAKAMLEAGERTVEVIDANVMDAVRKHGHEMTNSEILAHLGVTSPLSATAESNARDAVSLWDVLSAIGDEASDAAIANVKDLFKRQAAIRQRAEGWIPVRERLPEPGWRTVLFYDEDGVTYMGHHGENGWIDDANVDATYSLGVTHWMPLPAAPKGGT